jgi:hypothetical protein
VDWQVEAPARPTTKAVLASPRVISATLPPDLKSLDLGQARTSKEEDENGEQASRDVPIVKRMGYEIAPGRSTIGSSIRGVVSRLRCSPWAERLRQWQERNERTRPASPSWGENTVVAVRRSSGGDRCGRGRHAPARVGGWPGASACSRLSQIVGVVSHGRPHLALLRRRARRDSLPGLASRDLTNRRR